jgi:HD-GYP domain-containing protein (c-di-GMP phosphodiesterase class II)
MASDRSLHRLLITRLTLVVVLVSAVVAAIAGVTEERRLRLVVEERASQGVGALRALLLDQLDPPVLADRAAVERMLARIGAPGPEQAVGRFVRIRILDVTGAEVARLERPPGLAAGDYAEWDRAAVAAPPTDRQVGLRRIAGRRYVRVLEPMPDRNGLRAGWAEGVFEVSTAHERESLGRLARAVALAVGIVLATTLVLYPVVVRLLDQVGRLTGDLLEANLAMMRVLGSAVAKRDSDTDAHNFRATLFATRIAEAAGLDPPAIRVVIKGAFLHDIGKIGTPDQVLHKPGKLTDEEYAVMKRHVDHGLEIVASADWLSDAVHVVGGHHEKYDGTGYHQGRRGEDIPLPARIFAIADVFDAVTSKRPYHEPMSYERAMELLERGSGTHFDPRLIGVFRGLSRELFDRYADRDDETLRSDVASLVGRYFRGGLADLLPGR